MAKPLWLSISSGKCSRILQILWSNKVNKPTNGEAIVAFYFQRIMFQDSANPVV